MNEPELTPEMEKLSDDAKAIAGMVWGMGGKTEVNFRMRESRPTARTQAALDELVAAGMISATPIDGGPGAVSYKPIVDLNPLAVRAMKRALEGTKEGFRITEPIRQGSGA